MIGPFRSNNEEHKWRSTLQSLLLRFSSPSGKIYVKGVWFVVNKAHYFHDIIGQLERWISCKYNRITSISYLRSIIHLEFLKNCLKIFFGAFQLMTADLCFTFTTSVHTTHPPSLAMLCFVGRHVRTNDVISVTKYLWRGRVGSTTNLVNSSVWVSQRWSGFFLVSTYI